ncbi:MAG TPA: hypothetical protein VGM59_11665 [Dongiaceae bacterium]
MGNETGPTDAASTAPDESGVVHGNAHGKVRIRVIQNILRVDISGEPEGEALTGSFREALAGGLLRMSMPTLVDLTGFIGGVDWTGIRTIAEMAPWGSPDQRPSRVAYVTRNDWFAALLKLVSAIFPQSTHKQFNDVESGLRWPEASDNDRNTRRING